MISGTSHWSHFLLAVAGFATGVLLVPSCSDANGGGGDGGSGGGTGTGGSAATGGTAGSGGYIAGSGGGTATDGAVVTGEGGLPSGCATDSYTGELVPLDMYVLLDQSGSMGASDTDGGPSRWSQVTGAITEFMALPGTNEIGMGMGFFPVEPSMPAPVQCSGPGDCYPYSEMCMMGQCIENIGEDNSCIPADYRVPAVPIDLLPGVAGPINGAMSSHGPTGMTPMAPALWGAMEYATDWANGHPEHITIVVLATDGLPTNCVNNEVENVSAVASGGLDNMGIQTFVIGIGNDLDELNEIAAAGGTGAALMVDTGNASAEFLEALNQIRGSVGCTYKIPDPDEGEPDFNKVNVAYTPDGGQQQIYLRVKGEADCQGGPGWYYDDPSDPKQIILCPAACDEVQHTSGRVDIVLGCQSLVK